MHTIAWKYTVRPERSTEFESAYGPEGPWVRLFREAEGYEGTELYRSTSRPDEFLTLDRWTSEQAFARFRRERAEQYERIDRAMEGMTLDEEKLFAG